MLSVIWIGIMIWPSFEDSMPGSRGFTFFRVHPGYMNGSGRHSVHTVAWLGWWKTNKATSPKRVDGLYIFRKLYYLMIFTYR